MIGMVGSGIIKDLNNGNIGSKVFLKLNSQNEIKGDL
jgi:hypothetical protein